MNNLKKWVLSIIIIYSLVCVLTGLYYGDEFLLGSFESFNNDDVKYIRSADVLIKTGKFTYNYPTSSTAFIMPGIVLALVPFVKIFGMYEAPIYFRMFSGIINSITMYIFFLIALKVFNKKIAILTLALNLIYIPHIYVSNLILTETIFSFFLAVLILVSIYAVKYKKIKYYILGGVILGITILFRPSIALYPLIIFIVLCKEKYKIKEILKFTVIIIIACSVALLPWWIRNYITFDKFIPFTLSNGNPMLQGAFINNEVDHQLIAKLNTENFIYTDSEIINNEIESKLAQKVYSYFFMNDFWNYLKWNTIDKTILNFGNPYYGLTLYGIPRNIIILQHRIYMIFGLVGMFNKKYIILLIPIYFALMHLPVLAYSRYMYPSCAYLIMLMASALVEKYNKNISSNKWS